MTYAHITDSVIQAVGRLPQSARRLDTQEWVLGLADATVTLREACGWFPVTDTTRPEDTATTTHDRTVELVAGVPTVVWTERPKTQAELDAEQETANRTTIDQAITDALTRLQELVDAPAIPAVPNGTMTNAVLSDVVRALRDHAQDTRAGAQEVALTLRRTIRLVRGDYDGTS